MKNIILTTVACLLLTTTAAWGQDAMKFYERGLKSSLAYKKIQHFSKAIQLDPNLAEAYEKRGIHYYFQKKLDKAIEDYTRVVELRPDRANAFLMRGLAYLKKGHGEGFFAELDRLTRRFFKTAATESNACLDRAIADFSRAIELDRELAAAYAYRAEAYRFKGMIDEAIRDATMAIKLQKDQDSTADAYATQAEIYRQLGRTELYEANLRKAVDLDPYSSDYPPLHVPLMLRYSVDNPSLKAIRWLGLIGIIVLAFVVIFQLTLRPPHKRE